MAQTRKRIQRAELLADADETILEIDNVLYDYHSSAPPEITLDTSHSSAAITGKEQQQASNPQTVGQFCVNVVVNAWPPQDGDYTIFWQSPDYLYL